MAKGRSAQAVVSCITVARVSRSHAENSTADTVIVGCAEGTRVCELIWAYLRHCPAVTKISSSRSSNCSLAPTAKRRRTVSPVCLDELSPGSPTIMGPYCSWYDMPMVLYGEGRYSLQKMTCCLASVRFVPKALVHMRSMAAVAQHSTAVISFTIPAHPY